MLQRGAKIGAALECRPMRFAVLLVLALLALPAVAAEWTSYDNARFGYEIAIPPSFVPNGPESENGDGLVFVTTDATQLLRVYAGNIIEGDFESAVGRAMDAATEAGWDLSYKRVTPRWTSYSGTRGDMILYARAISLCDGTQFASFEIEYPAVDLDWMHGVIERLVASLKATGHGINC
jgi:hypothetical protein